MKVLRLKEYRKKAIMTQKEVAKAMNVTQAQYSRWENGINFPNPSEILDLCKLFNCTPNDIFGILGAMSVAFDPLFNNEKKG